MENNIPDFLENANTWVTLAFILFAYVAYKYGRGSLLNKLDTRISEIRHEIQTAESLRIEAQELLAQYQRRQRDAVRDAEQIVENAKQHAVEILRDAEKEIADTTARREQQLALRLKRMEEAAIQEIQTYAATLAVNATRKIIEEKMDEAANGKLVDKALKSMPDYMN